MNTKSHCKSKMAVWQQYAHHTGQAIAEGAEKVYHGLETALGVYGTLHGAYELAGAIGGGLRTLGAIAPAAAGLVL